MKLICPKCMKPVPVPDDFTGSEVTCPECKTPFAVPSRYTPAVLPEPAPVPPPVPAPPPIPEPPTPAVIPPKPPETYGMSPAAPPEKPTPPAVPEKPALPAAPQKPSPPSGYIPPVPTETAPPPRAYEPPPMPAGYTHARGITISPKVIAWLPAVLLVLTLFCTFFTWVGSYPGNIAMDTQGPWNAMFGYSDHNDALDLALEARAKGGEGGQPKDATQTGTSTESPTDVSWISNVKSDWALLVPYFLCLFAATALALADRGFHSFDPRNIPPLAKIWPWRKTAIGVLAALAFLFIFIANWRGFSMERAIRQSVSARFTDERAKATSNPGEAARVKYREAQAFERYNVERTTWCRLGIAFNLLAVLALVTHIRLNRRGDKPPPRIVLQY